MPKADIHLYIYLNLNQTQGGPNSCDAFNLLWSQLSDAKQNAIVAKPAKATFVACLFITFHLGPKAFLLATCRTRNAIDAIDIHLSVSLLVRPSVRLVYFVSTRCWDCEIRQGLSRTATVAFQFE